MLEVLGYPGYQVICRLPLQGVYVYVYTPCRGQHASLAILIEPYMHILILL